MKEAGVEGAEVELAYGEGRIPEEDQLAEIYKAQIDETGLKVKLTKVKRLQYNEISGADFDKQRALFMETTSSGNYGEIANSLLDKYGCEGSGTFCDPALDDRFRTLLSMEGDRRITELNDVVHELQEQKTPRAWCFAVNQVHGLASNVETTLPLNVYIRMQNLRFA